LGAVRKPRRERPLRAKNCRFTASGNRAAIAEEAMDQKTYDIGMKMRRMVLGDEYVDRAIQNVDDFNRDFQRIVTQYCWGEAWGDQTLTPRERSILNLGMIAALGKMEEFQTHVRGALRNGLTPDEIRAVLTQIAVYCGIPVGVDCFRVARPIVNEHQKGKK
jgi:4-carboxymuconolactone decarboxylase